MLIHPAEEGGYWTEVPALPGCYSQGETVEAALAHTKEAIESHLEALHEEGQEVVGDEQWLIGHVHVADVPGRHQPGTGELNYGTILGKLRDAGFEGFIGLEFEPTIPSKEAAAAALKLIKG